MDNFKMANNELGELINCEIFGKDIKELTLCFGEISNSEYFGKALDLWLHDTNQYGKENVKEFIKIFLDIISNSINIDDKNTINEITCFLKGDTTHKRTETISSYMEYIFNNRTFIEEVSKKSKEEKSIKNAKQVSNLLIDSYSKGVEYISKIYSLIIILFCIINKTKINIETINKKKLYEKCKDIKSKGKYNLLVDSIDRNIRNSDAHLNIYYNVEKEAYVYKRLIKGKWKYTEVSAYDMAYKVYSKIGWIIQGFMYSLTLLLIGAHDRNKYIEYINKIF